MPDLSLSTGPTTLSAHCMPTGRHIQVHMRVCDADLAIACTCLMIVTTSAHQQTAQQVMCSNTESVNGLPTSRNLVPYTRHMAPLRQRLRELHQDSRLSRDEELPPSLRVCKPLHIAPCYVLGSDPPHEFSDTTLRITLAHTHSPCAQIRMA